jgi:SHS2 domain-containing protein
MMFEELDHTADLAIRVAAIDLSGLLAEAARAVIELSGIALESSAVQERTIRLTSEDPESLLVQWLEELLFEIEVKNRASLDFPITIDGEYSLEATVKLVPIASISRLIKAVTFHQMDIKTVDDQLQTVIVFDV